MTRPKHRDLSTEQRRNANTRSYANVYKRRGILAREPCRLCRAPIAQMHHTNYDDRLDIDWLCAPCHKIWHMWLNRKSAVGAPSSSPARSA